MADKGAADGGGPKPIWRRIGGGVLAVLAFLGIGGLLGNRLWGWFETNVVDTERVSIVVVEDPRVYYNDAPNWESFEWVFARRPTSLTRPPSDDCKERWPWAQAMNGIDARATHLRVHIVGDGAENVVLEQVRPRVRRRLPPATGTYARCPVGGADLMPRQVSIDLDAKTPTVSYYDNAGGAGPPPGAYVFPKGQKEREIFDILGWTERCLCEWYVEFYFRVGDSTQSLVRRVPASGYLRTTGIRRADPVIWRGGRWRAAPLDF